MEISSLHQLFLSTGKVSTDSRKIEPGCIFFALRGDNFNGNQYAQSALEQGASYAVVDDPALATQDRCIVVDDVLDTLQALAKFHRRQLHIPIIAITGSNGKTTTKELIAAVLGSQYPMHYTQGNLNNHIGVPLTLLQLDFRLEVAVIEMGANHQGEIDQLCRIAEPTHGLITNIGKAHLEGFGGIEGVKKGKSELYRYLAETDGLAFVNNDEPFLVELSSGVRKRIFYERSDDPAPNHKPYEVVLLQLQPFIRVAFLDENNQLIEAGSKLMGEHNFQNIKTAVTLGKYFKVPGKKIKAAIENYNPNMNRSQWVSWGTNSILLDAYNANPSSMEVTLRSFSESPASQRIAILGDMFELGESSAVEHERVAQLAQSLNFEQVILVGQHFAAIARQLGWLHFPNVGALKPWFEARQWENTAFLIKGSRGMALEKLLG
ncbi:UDP-N-acetylmuramoyl-tripeptide--D-alanyl-D-alanine ligase [Haliscomenobacter hydrossis]|uniref:UDP-N-acetylmuramoyl-tripeptide--D-alanyl-D-alanine ligase n=1 Tax=Haliscomenobacter hydrossis (strain ATCC 27775 / DSM 1100 / LMG 10767 / O) TaxID=760192 RepID=F4KXX4_HALH1|nr:UDP-N-acetylmuramoyl-tripeptide--D-alanyl-D-alanine ligase [Haliscomenobacter hydrossis]AEE52633.1 UDP-N-acetylmuramoylalanyl-D-glutamyl-2,6-diamin opimelate/D-alanyl-D-alanyl ligase [Haliscomenobacter hydrossis DSM 1100]